MRLGRIAAVSKCEETDAFWAFKPLGLISAATGLLPWPLKKHHDKSCFRKLFTLSYSLVVVGFIVCSVPQPPQVFIIGKRGGTATDTTVLFGLLARLMLGSVMYAIIITRSDRVCEVLENLCALDKLFPNSATINQIMRVRVALFVTHIVFVLLLFFVVKTIDDHMYHFSDVYYMWFTSNNIVLIKTLLYQITFFAMSVGKRLDTLSTEIIKICTTLQDIFPREDEQVLMAARESDISKLGSVFFELCDVIEDLESIYSPFLVLYYCYATIGIVAYGFFIIFHMLSDLNGAIHLVHIVAIIQEIASIIIMTSALGRLPIKATKPLKHLIRVRTSSLSPDCQMQIQGLIQKMSGPPIIVTAAKFFAVDHGLLTAIAGSVTTYLIVLVQFRDAEHGCKY